MSLRAKFTNWHLRRTVKSNPLNEIDPAILRINMDAFAPKRIPDGLTVRDVSEVFDGAAVRGEWQRPAAGAGAATIYYLHGGGYVFGSPRSHRKLTFMLARMTGAQVFSLDYRLAPEYPFPAAIEDATAGWRWLMDNGVDPARTVIAGDSAGGGLTLALAAAIGKEGLPPAAGLVAFSPWADLAATGASMEDCDESDAMFRAEYLKKGAERVLQGADARAPLASPLYADVAGFPPSLLFASRDEVLRDDAVRMHEKLVAAGVPSELVLEKGLPHVWPVFVGAFPEAMVGVERAAAFIRARTGMPGDGQ